MIHLLHLSFVYRIFTNAFIACQLPFITIYSQKKLFKKLSPCWNSCLMANSRAYRATPIYNMEAKVGVLPLGSHPNNQA
jgi:hypothetical protein